MSFLRIFNTNKSAGLFTVLFISAWFLCAGHVSFADQATTQTDHHDQACLDHTPTPTAFSHHNDLTDAPMFPSDATRVHLKNLDQVADLGLIPTIFDDDHLQKRYTFLKNNTIRT